MRSHDSPLPFPAGRQSVEPVLAVNPVRLQGSCLVGALERAGATGEAVQFARKAEESGDGEALAAAEAAIEQLEPGVRGKILEDLDRYQTELARLAKAGPGAILEAGCRGLAVMAARKRGGHV